MWRRASSSTSWRPRHRRRAAWPGPNAVDAHQHLAAVDAEGMGDLGIENLYNLLHFQIVIPGAERAHLLLLARLGMFGYMVRTCTRHATMLLDALEVRDAAVASIDGPARASGLFMTRKPPEAMAPIASSG